MKTTIRIAKLELNNLFYSPIAWIVLVGFTIFTAYEIVPSITHQVIRQNLWNQEAYGSIAHGIFTTPRFGYFSVTRTLLMVLIPLISMGVISREASTGSIKLLYSSPIKLGSIVIGKYLAIMVMVSILMLVALLAVFIAYVSVEHFDIGRLISAFIHLYLFAALIASIAVFVSTFSAYPIVDAVATIALVYGLDLLYNLVDEVPVINVIMYWIAPSQQMGYAFNGLVTSQSLMYFIALILMFVSWAYFRMVLKRQTSNAKWFTRVKMTALLFIAMGVIYATTQPTLLWYKDITAEQKNVLKPTSKEALADLKGQPIKITTYVNIFGDNPYGLMPERQIMDKRFFHRYYLEFPQIQMEYVYYYNPLQLETVKYQRMIDKSLNLDETVLFFADLLKMDVSDIHNINDLGLSGEIIKNYINFPFRILESNGKQSILKYQFDDQMGTPQEAQISAALKRLVGETYKMAFVKGHNERGINVNEQLAKTRSAYYNKINYPYNYDLYTSSVDERNSLVNNGFDVVSISLEQEVPSDVDVLVIAEPKSAFSELELANLKEYADNGGNLIITSGRGNENIMNPIVTDFGVEYLPGMLVNDNPNYPAGYNLADVTDEFNDMPWETQVQMVKATALKVNETSGFKSSVLFSSRESEAWMDMEGPNEYGEIEYQPAKGGQKAVLPLAVQLERQIKGKIQKVFIAGDADFMSNERRYNAPAGIRIYNSRIMIYLSEWFTNGTYPMDIPFADDKDIRVSIAYKNLVWLRLLLYFMLPGIFAFLGLRMLVKRMRN